MAAFLLIAATSFIAGCFIYSKPQAVIKIQQKFYEYINWRMEPISMAKEIRNTQFMGLFLILFVTGVSIYYAVSFR